MQIVYHHVIKRNMGLFLVTMKIYQILLSWCLAQSIKPNKSPTCLKRWAFVSVCASAKTASYFSLYLDSFVKALESNKVTEIPLNIHTKV